MYRCCCPKYFQYFSSTALAICGLPVRLPCPHSQSILVYFFTEALQLSRVHDCVNPWMENLFHDRLCTNACYALYHTVTEKNAVLRQLFLLMY